MQTETNTWTTWEPHKRVTGPRGKEAGPCPFDDVRAEPIAEVLDGRTIDACPECRGSGSLRGFSDCPTCRGSGEVVAYFGGFLARDGLARYL